MVRDETNAARIMHGEKVREASELRAACVEYR